MKYDEEQQYQDHDELIHQLDVAYSKNKIHDWSVKTVREEKKNLYLEKNGKMESSLDGERTQRHVTIFLYDEQNQTTGEASFMVTSGDSEEDIQQEIDEALIIANTQKNPLHRLPTPEDQPVDDQHIDYVNLQDLRFHTDFKSGNLLLFLNGKLALLHRMIKDAQEPGITLYLNSLELFNTLRYETIKTSQGINKSFSTQSAYLEMILSARDQKSGEEREHILYEPIANLYEYDFHRSFERHISYTKDALRATNTPSHAGQVVLSGSAAKDFFVPDLTYSPFIGHCSARLQYAGISRFKRHEDIVKDAKENLSISLNPLRTDAYAQPFDRFGIAGRRIDLIADNRCLSYFGEKRYMEYLNETPNGPPGIVEVNTGKNPYEELFGEEDTIEIITFSSFVPDMTSGTVSAEIRFGYLHSKNGEKQPITGGLFSANLFTLLTSMRKSREEQKTPGYVGPYAIAFPDGEIHGEK